MSKLPNIEQDFSGWYNQVVFQAQLADNAPVKGCIIIRPYGYALWESIKTILDKKIKDTGHHNAYFPLLIPQSFLAKEAQHVEGFAPELAIVTHAGGKKLEDPLVVRPTSETIIHAMFAQWIRSWRDLPLKINQWANVVRWEMRTRPFLRTTEFLWQEGHTAHETAQEAYDEAHMMLNEYVDLLENYLAIPLIKGKKSQNEKFAGADTTLTMEGIMPDGKALQLGTSHILSQSFAHAFDMSFQTRNGTLEYPFLTSWGLTTRLIGSVVMMHGDQKGLILPPNIAPTQVVIIPIIKTGVDDNQLIIECARQLRVTLVKAGIRVELDESMHETPGAKFYTWELKGVPLRLEIGPKDYQAGVVTIAHRLTGVKHMVAYANVIQEVHNLLKDFQQQLFARAQSIFNNHLHTHSNLAEFGSMLDSKAGAYRTGWCGSTDCENKIKDYKATIRCVLPEEPSEICCACTAQSIHTILVARAY